MSTSTKDLLKINKKQNETLELLQLENSPIEVDLKQADGNLYLIPAGNKGKQVSISSKGNLNFKPTRISNPQLIAFLNYVEQFKSIRLID